MVEGYLISSGRILSKPDYDTFLDVRASIGYEKCPPDLHIPSDKKVIQLKFAELGLVETEIDAKTFCSALEAKLPEFNWGYCKKTHPEAVKIT